jgi:signal transduction histidine kinase
VAAYRIVAEALTNVVRHSHARCCEVTVRLTEEEVLAIDVRDDGVGLHADRSPGVGLRRCASVRPRFAASATCAAAMMAARW